MERAVVEYLANALWQVPLLVAGVAALLWALGSDVRTRHRVWLAVLAVALVIPLRGMDVGGHAAAPARFQAAPARPGAGMAAILPAETLSAGTSAVEPSLGGRRQPALVFGEVSGRWLVRLYGAALAFFAWRILRAWIAAQGLLRRSRSIDLAPRAMAIFAQVAEAAKVPLPRLRQSDETVSPVVIGAVKPVLLLPAGFDRLKDDEILAALSHEFAHLSRRDYLVNLLCQVGALPLAWHPAIQYVQKRIRDTREMLCDAAAAQEMASPVRYATCLVAFALRALEGNDAALATQGLSMFDNRILEQRILHLTEAPEQPDPGVRLARLAGASIGLILAVAMALLFHITPTWADTPADPVQLTPTVELPAVPAAPAPPAAPSALSAPSAPPAPAEPSAPAKPRHAAQADTDMRRAIAEEERERGAREREQAQRQREVAQLQRDEAQRQRDAAREAAQREREVAQLQREEERRQRDAAREAAERERERAEVARDAAEQQREAAREAMEEARREALEASRNYAAEIRRQVAEAVKAGKAANEIDMEKIKQEIAQAGSAVHTPEFKAQMAELQSHMQALHDHMAELRAQMKDLDREVGKSLKPPM